MRSHDGEMLGKSGGSRLNNATNDNFHDFYFSKVNQTFYTCNAFDIMKSTTGNQMNGSAWRSGVGFVNNVTVSNLLFAHLILIYFVLLEMLTGFFEYI